MQRMIDQSFRFKQTLHVIDRALLELGPQAEYQFCLPRKWRFDWAWVDQRVAVEIDGGQWLANGGRHNTDADRDKLNAAAALGWRVLRFSTQQLDTDPMTCVDLLRLALNGATPDQIVKALPVRRRGA